VVVAAVAIAAVGLAACNSDPTAPEPQVIEQVTFDPSLNVDLAAMTKLPEGVYIQDLVVGTGTGLVDGDQAWTYYELRLSNAQPIGNGLFDFELGAGEVIQGWDIGMEGMMPGGTRVLLIPPELGYGAVQYGPIPAGSVLHFRVELDSITWGRG
jgi:FKBP-type peptidyl-prolyl cis-trans isomerase